MDNQLLNRDNRPVKIIILTMCCNIQHFKTQFEICKYTYAKDIIEGKYPHIEFWGYTSSTDGKYHINKKTHMIEVPCDDDSITGTYKKTINVFRLLRKRNIEFSYILRTNCSTYINVPLLNDFVQNYETKRNICDFKIFAGTLTCSETGSGPFDWCLFGTGNCILLHHDIIDILIDTSVESCRQYNTMNCPEYDKLSIYNIDDNAIATVINTYAYLHNHDLTDIWHEIPLTQYQTTEENELYKYIAITVRDYTKENNYNNREHEYEMMIRIDHVLKGENTKQPVYPIQNFDNNIKSIHIVDYRKGLHSIVERSWGIDFMKIMNPYLNKLELEKQNS